MDALHLVSSSHLNQLLAANSLKGLDLLMHLCSRFPFSSPPFSFLMSCSLWGLSFCVLQNTMFVEMDLPYLGVCPTISFLFITVSFIMVSLSTIISSLIHLSWCFSIFQQLHFFLFSNFPSWSSVIRTDDSNIVSSLTPSNFSSFLLFWLLYLLPPYIVMEKLSNNLAIQGTMSSNIVEDTICGILSCLSVSSLLSISGFRSHCWTTPLMAFAWHVSDLQLRSI